MGFRLLVPTGGGAALPSLPSYEAGAFGLATVPVDHTTGSTNVKGAWTQLGTLNQPVDQLTLQIYSNSNRPILLDVKAGANLIIESLAINLTGGFAQIVFPLRTPAGTIEFRAATNSTSQTVSVLAFAAVGSVQSTATLLRPIGPVGATVVGTGVAINSIPVSGAAWTEIGISVQALVGIVPYLGTNGTVTGRTGATYMLEIGTGVDAATAVSIGAVWAVRSSTTALIGEAFRPFMKSFGPGIRFFGRVSCPLTATPDSCNLQLHGFGQA